MVDIFSKKKRSEIMSKIHGRDTSIELRLRKLLKQNKLRGFTYQPKMEGKPDFIFEKKKIAVFCDGSFWHGRKFGTWRNKISKFWRIKISSNIARDKKKRGNLRKHGWRVIRFWDIEIRKYPNLVISRIRETMRVRR